MNVADRSRPPWTDELLDLAAQEATGRLVVSADAGRDAWIYLRDGLVCGVSGGARRPLLSRRLVAFGALSADRVLAELATARARPGVRLVDLLVAHGLVSDLFVETYLRNSMAEQLSIVLAAPGVEVSYQPGRVQRTGPLMIATHDVLATALVAPHEFPPDLARSLLSATGSEPGNLLTIHRTVRAASDGRQRPLEVAEACGLTTAEMIQVIADLRQAGAIALGAQAPAPTAAPEPSGAGDVPPATVPTPPASAAALPATEPPVDPPVDMVVVRPFAPEPVDPDPDEEAAPHGTRERREALSALKSLTEGLVEPTPPPPQEPQSEVTTTAPPRAWHKRPQRPLDPMESGDVLRELKSLGDQ